MSLRSGPLAVTVQRSARWSARVPLTTASLVLVMLSASLGLGAQSGATASSAPPSASAVQENVVAVDSVVEENTRLVASELRCPVCQGSSIQDSPSELAQEMKGVVRDQLASGKSPDEVKAYFVAKYGEWILLAPTPKGFNLVAYLLPVAAVLAGALVIWRSVRKWTAGPAGAGGESGGVSVD